MPSLEEQNLSGEQLAEIEDKYDQERFERYRPEGLGQFVDTTRSEKWKRFAADPWYDLSQPPRGRQDVPTDRFIGRHPWSTPYRRRGIQSHLFAQGLAERKKRKFRHLYDKCAG